MNLRALKKKEKVAVVERPSDIYIPVDELYFKNEGGVIDLSAMNNSWFYNVGSKISHDLHEGPDFVKSMARSIITDLNHDKRFIRGDNDISINTKLNTADGFDKDDSLMCRVHYDLDTAAGPQLNIRLQPGTPPHLSLLSLPFGLIEYLTHQSLEKGGLILIVAPLGQGKSTTLAAALIERLLLFGGQAVTVEDPIEHNLTGDNRGRWGLGRVTQKNVATSRNESFATAVRATLRMLPAAPGNSFLFGEIRDSETAVEAIQAATSGSLVLATVHGNSATSGIDRFINYTAGKYREEMAYNMLGDCLRLSICQSLEKLDDGYGNPHWGSHAPKVDLFHNFFWKKKMSPKIKGAFNPETGITKGLKSVIEDQTNIHDIAINGFKKSVEMIKQNKSPSDVEQMLKQTVSDDASKLRLKAKSFESLHAVNKQGKLTDDHVNCIMRRKGEIQAVHAPKELMDVRKLMVDRMLDHYYTNM